ncbi:hypothetical protein FOZ63_011460, partial [Perkinsus olseni]
SASSVLPRKLASIERLGLVPQRDFEVYGLFHESRSCLLLPNCAYSERKNMSLVIGLDPIEARVLFLDAEGSEVAILGGYDFQAEPEIRVIVVEASDPRRYIELEQIFYRNRYVKVAVLGGDW